MPNRVVANHVVLKTVPNRAVPKRTNSVPNRAVPDSIYNRAVTNRAAMERFRAMPCRACHFIFYPSRAVPCQIYEQNRVGMVKAHPW